MDERIAIRLKALEAKLAVPYPNAMREAEALAAQVIDASVADADAAWQRVWDKPLFANTKVATGVAAAAKLQPYMRDAWRTWGAPGSDIVIEKLAGHTRGLHSPVVGPTMSTCHYGCVEVRFRRTPSARSVEPVATAPSDMWPRMSDGRCTAVVGAGVECAVSAAVGS